MAPGSTCRRRTTCASCSWPTSACWRTRSPGWATSSPTTSSKPRVTFMATHVALLRGINLGGRNKVAMADLRAVVGELGHTGVSTYIQSGNVLLTAPPDAGTPAIAQDMTAAIAAKLGVTAPVVVVTRDELAAIVDANPFP